MDSKTQQDIFLEVDQLIQSKGTRTAKTLLRENKIAELSCYLAKLNYKAIVIKTINSHAKIVLK